MDAVSAVIQTFVAGVQLVDSLLKAGKVSPEEALKHLREMQAALPTRGGVTGKDHETLEAFIAQLRQAHA